MQVRDIYRKKVERFESPVTRGGQWGEGTPQLGMSPVQYSRFMDNFIRATVESVLHCSVSSQLYSKGLVFVEQLLIHCLIRLSFVAKQECLHCKLSGACRDFLYLCPYFCTAWKIPLFQKGGRLLFEITTKKEVWKKKKLCYDLIDNDLNLLVLSQENKKNTLSKHVINAAGLSLCIRMMIHF